jgi:hypothetical protein
MTDTPDFDKMSPKELMKWMESLAVRQGVAVPSAPSVGDRVRRFIFKDIPSWMHGGTPAATVALVTAPVEPSAAQVMDDFDRNFKVDIDDDLFDDLDAEFDDFDDSVKK